MRRALAKGKVSELTFTKQGIYSCILALLLMAGLPFPVVRDSAYSTAVLYTIATCLAYTSATCVTGMMAAAAACCDEDDERGVSAEKSSAGGRLPRGRALGGFRSRVSLVSISLFSYSLPLTPLDAYHAAGSTRSRNRSHMGDDPVLDTRPNFGLFRSGRVSRPRCGQHAKHGQR